MARSQTSQLIMELLDRVSGPARRVGASVRGMNRAVKDNSGVQVSMADRIAASQARTTAALDRARLGVVDTIGAYYLLRDAVTAPIRAAAEFETALEDIGQKAGIPVDKLGALGEQIKTVARDTNQATSDIAAAVDALVGRGAATDVALAAAAPIGKAATAYRASTDDLAAASWSAVDNLKVPADQIESALDAMAQAGKEGAFELRDMATYFPALGAAYQGLGQDGVDAVADLAAALQVVRKGTGDSSSAATNLQNVLQKIYAPATVKNFGKKGINVFKEMEAAAKRGLTPIEAIAELTDKALKGDLSKMGTLFEDAQVQAGMRSLIQGMEEYRAIREKAMGAKGVVDADYERRIKTAAGATARWKASVENLNIALGTTLLPLLNDVLDRVIPLIEGISNLAAAHPDLTRNVMAAAGALIAFRGAYSLLRFVGLLGKSGALAMLAAAFGNVGTQAGAAATAVEASVARSNAAISRLRIKALSAGLMSLMALSKVPTEPEQLAEFQAKNRRDLEATLRATPLIGSMMNAYEDVFKSVHGKVPPTPEQAGEVGASPQQLREQPVLDAAATIEAAKAVLELRAKQDELLAKIEAQGSEFSDGFDATSMDLAKQLADVQADLDVAEGGAANLETALAAIGMADVSPQVDTAALDRALEKANLLLTALRRSQTIGTGGGEGGERIIGARAKGGPVSRGATYLVGEDGPEVMTASRSGYIHPTGKGAVEGVVARAKGIIGARAKGGPLQPTATSLVGEDLPQVVSGSNRRRGQAAEQDMQGQPSPRQKAQKAVGGVQIGAINIPGISLNFPDAKAADAEAIAETVMKRLKDDFSAALRGVMADVSMGY